MESMLKSMSMILESNREKGSKGMAKVKCSPEKTRRCLVHFKKIIAINTLQINCPLCLLRTHSIIDIKVIIMTTSYQERYLNHHFKIFLK